MSFEASPCSVSSWYAATNSGDFTGVVGFPGWVEELQEDQGIGYPRAHEARGYPPEARARHLFDFLFAAEDQQDEPACGHATWVLELGVVFKFAHQEGPQKRL